MAEAKTVWFSFYLGCHRSAVSPSALNVSPLTQLPRCGIHTPASVSPPSEGRSRPTNTSVFPPSSFILPSFAWFYVFFPLVRYSCTLSAGVLHALLCLKVYSWYICGKRCTPHPPAPLPSCSSLAYFLISNKPILTTQHLYFSLLTILTSYFTMYFTTFIQQSTTGLRDINQTRIRSESFINQKRRGKIVIVYLLLFYW